MNKSKLIFINGAREKMQRIEMLRNERRESKLKPITPYEEKITKKINRFATNEKAIN